MATWFFIIIFKFLFALLSISGTSTQDAPCSMGIHFSDGIISDGEEKEEYYRDYFHFYNAECGLFFMEWKGSYCRIVRADDLHFSLSYNECTEDYYGVVHTAEDNPMRVSFVFGGIAGMVEKEFDTVNDVLSPIFPEDYIFEFGGRKYELFARGTYTEERYDQAKDVRIYFSDTGSGTTQELSYIPKLEYTQPSVIFIGDLDGDGLPDLILSEGYNYELVDWVLYLSSMAGEGELVKRTASHRYWADC